MKLFSTIGSIILAACGSASHVDNQGREVIVVHAKGDTPFAELTSTRTITRELQLRFGCAYQYEEVIAGGAGAEAERESEESSFMIDTSGKDCSKRPSNWYVLVGPKSLDEVQRYVDLVARVMAGDYGDETSTPSLKGKQPKFVDASGGGVELSYVIPPYNYLVKIDMSKDPPSVVDARKWQ